MALPATLGELRATGYQDRSVKEELRDNLITRLSSAQPLFPTIVGYEESVIPTLERAILAGHDIIMLGERGQAKSRLIRSLVTLLDEALPVVEGCELNDHPYHPFCARCRKIVETEGDATPVAWIGREQRYAEKLATPDTAVADLIGDVDPIRVAEGRYLSDELTIHYGLVPRTHRGIFGINELPDLPERIQVSLLNILEERDVQVRGYKILLPLDLMLVASSNPEDYTHRGRIISPLKDRFGSQVRTHYPRRASDEIRIMDQEARPPAAAIPVCVPHFLKEVMAALAAQLRANPSVSQRSGVSVRLSIGGLETMGASALRRALRSGEREAIARPVDLWAVLPSAIGRVEFDTLDEGREPEILERALKQALLEVWRARLSKVDLLPLLGSFEAGLVYETSDEMRSEEALAQLDPPSRSRMQDVASTLGFAAATPAALASTLEFCLEGLHLTRRLNKHATGAPGGWTFSDERR